MPPTFKFNKASLAIACMVASLAVPAHSSGCNQVVVKTIEGAICESIDFDSEINNKVILNEGCEYIVTNCNITASAAGEMEHKAGSGFVMEGDTTVTMNGIARVAGGIDVKGGSYVVKKLLLISEPGVFQVHQDGEANIGETGSVYILGNLINENIVTNNGVDSDGDNDGVPYGITNDGKVTNKGNFNNYGSLKNKNEIENLEGGVINNDRLAATTTTTTTTTAGSCPLSSDPVPHWNYATKTFDQTNFFTNDYMYLDGTGTDSGGRGEFLYFMYPYGSYDDATVGNSVGLSNAYYTSPTAYSAKGTGPTPVFPAGVLIDASKGVDADYPIYGVFIRGRADISDQYVLPSAIRVKVAPTDCARSGALFDQFSTDDAIPTQSWCIATESMEGAFGCGQSPHPSNFTEVSLQTPIAGTNPGEGIVRFDTPVRARYVLVTVDPGAGSYNEYPSMRLALSHINGIE